MTTIVAPVGRSSRKETISPEMIIISDVIIETIVTPLNDFETNLEMETGMIIMLDISMIPSTFIPRTIVMAVMI